MDASYSVAPDLMNFAQNAENHDYTSNSAKSPNEQISDPNNKPRRSQYLRFMNFAFLSSDAAVTASYEM